MQKGEYIKVIHLKKLIERQLVHSQDMNLEYKLCKDFLANYKEDKYTKLVTSRTGKTKEELRSAAIRMIKSVNEWLYKTLSKLSDKEITSISNDPPKMTKFLKKVNSFIKENTTGLFALRSVG